jgi:hypothetical protein
VRNMMFSITLSFTVCEQLWTCFPLLQTYANAAGCRFPWFVLALNTVPVLLALISMVKPQLARGATTAFFSVLAPLNILMAHAFFNMAASPATDKVGSDVVKGTDEQWYKVRVVKLNQYAVAINGRND